MSRARHLQGIDALRGLAASGVALRHLQEQFWPVGLWPPIQTLAEWLGVWGVTLFFVVSGFCIHLPLAGRRLSDPSAPLDRAVYLRQRVLRIAPPYWVALAIALIVSAFAPTSVLVGPHGWWDVAAHLVAFHNLAPGTIYSVNGVFWTIAVEAQFYLLYLLICGRRIGLRLVGAMLAVGVACYLAAAVAIPHASAWRGTLQHFVAVSFWQWVLGAWLAEVYVRRPQWAWGPGRLVALRTAALTATLALAFGDFPILGLHPNVWALPFACGLVVLSLAMEPPGVPDKDGPLPALGRASYSLYLLHPVAIALAAYIAVPLAPALAAVLAVLFALASYRWIERPSMRLGRSPAALPA